MVEQAVREFARALRQTEFAGDIDYSAAARTVMATDNSVYEVQPEAVLYPRNAEDVQRILQLAHQRFPRLTFTARGGGTSTNGQSLGAGILIDCSRHMRAIKHIDLAQRVVIVEAGVVLDELNRFLATFGLFFPVSISTGSRATLGGMFNTNACGKGATYYGRMSDNVRGVTAVLADGSWLTTAAVSQAALAQKCASQEPEAALYRQVLATVSTHAEAIQALYPRLARTLTGYTLNEVCRGGNFDLTPVLAGSEGTLAVVTELTLQVCALPRYRLLAVVQYASFMQALADGVHIASTRPVAIETMDEKILSLAKQDSEYAYVKPWVTADTQPLGGLSLVEWVAESEQALAETQQAVQELLVTKPTVPRVGWYWITEPETMVRLWDLRKKCVGLLSNFEWQGRRPVSGIEDTLVPIAELQPFIQALMHRLEARGLTYGMYGHVDAGCIHVRPAFNLQDQTEAAHYVDLVRDVAALVRTHHGILWGEHGKGARSEFVPAVFGTTLFAELCKIKAAFDPRNRLNPGKIALITPDATPGLLTIDGYPLQAQLNHTIHHANAMRYQAALACNGNGACFNVSKQMLICPSYKVTRERIHSPKGRARLVRQWLRQRSGTDSRKTVGGWRRWISRWWQRGDFSHAVYQAMAGCLGCRGCQTQCPAQVNVPSFKATFLASYHSQYARSLKDYLFAQSEQFAWSQARYPKLANAFVHNPLSRYVLKACGLIHLPKLSEQSVATLLEPLGLRVTPYDTLLQQVSPDDVVIVQDFVTSVYEAELVVTVFQFLQRIGCRVWLLAPLINGKPWHVQGKLEDFHVAVKNNAVKLQAVYAKGARLVGIDPSLTLTYRHEYREAFPHLVMPPVLLLQELLEKVGLARVTFKPMSAPITLLMHCTEQVTSINSAAAWRAVFAAAGYAVTIAELGCCGMAGSYGLQRQHAQHARELFAMHWETSLMTPGVVLVTGYSCRSQIFINTGQRAQHPVTFLASQLQASVQSEQ